MYNIVQNAAPVQAIAMDLPMHYNPAYEPLEVACINQAKAPGQIAYVISSTCTLRYCTYCSIYIVTCCT